MQNAFFRFLAIDVQFLSVSIENFSNLFSMQRNERMKGRERDRSVENYHRVEGDER